MTRQALGTVLITGGTGMLAKATRFVAPLASGLTLGSRNPQKAALDLGASHLVLDWANRGLTLANLAKQGQVDLLISWLHDDGIWLVEHLEAKLKPQGRSIRIHGADSRDPAILAKRDPNPRPNVNRQTVILGWVNQTEGRRWLTNDEISDAVIAAVAEPERQVVVAGTLDD
jgi:hypothetical protein